MRTVISNNVEDVGEIPTLLRNRYHCHSERQRRILIKDPSVAPVSKLTDLPQDDRGVIA